MGRGYAAAKAKRQAAGAAAAGQGAVAEPAVAAQPAPAGETPERVALVAERANEGNANLTQANLTEYEKDRRAIDKNARVYGTKEDSIFRLQGGGAASRYKEVADGTILARMAAENVANAIRNAEKGSPKAASASAQLKDSIRLLRSASNRLKGAQVRKYSLLALDIRDARYETRRAANLIAQAAANMNIRAYLPGLLP